MDKAISCQTPTGKSIPAKDRQLPVRLQSPVFIVGYPRSGTTLLQCLLSAHSEMFSLPETHFFSEALRKTGKTPSAPILYEDLDIIFTELESRLKLGDRLKEEFKKASSESYWRSREIFEHIIDCHRPGWDRENRLRVVEKTPGHVYFLKQIYNLYPDAKFVFIVRDPRGAISSRLRMPTAKSRYLPEYIDSWNKVNRLAIEFQHSNPNAITIIRYEDLTQRTETVIKEVLKFLDVDFESGMIAQFANEYSRNVLADEDTWKSGIKTGKIYHTEGMWQSRITPDTAWLIEKQAIDFMRRYGYDPISAPSIMQKAKALIGVYKIGADEGKRVNFWIYRFLTTMISDSIRWIRPVS